MTRLFKPGDRVRLFKGGPVMHVIKYEPETQPLVGSGVSNSKVRCVWYDKNQGRKEDVFHQRSLTKELIYKHHKHRGQSLSQSMNF